MSWASDGGDGGARSNSGGAYGRDAEGNDLKCWLVGDGEAWALIEVTPEVVPNGDVCILGLDLDLDALLRLRLRERATGSTLTISG